MTDFWSVVRACLIQLNFMSSSWILEGRKGPFLFVSSTLTGSKAGWMLILSSLLPSLSDFMFLRECLQCVFLLGQNFIRLENASDSYSVLWCSTEVSVAVKTEGRNHKSGALQRIMRGREVKFSVRAHTDPTLIWVNVCKGIYTTMKIRAS